MFELQSRTFYDKKFTLGYAVVFMNRNNHAAKFEQNIGAHSPSSTK